MIPSVLFSLVERKMECTKTHDPPEMVAEFYAVPHFQVHKKVWPPSHFHLLNPFW